MKKVVTTPAVDLALRTLGPDEVRRIHAWFIHLANWDDDPFVRENSHVLEEVPGAHVFRTSTDIRIFFTIEGGTITVLDVAGKQSIITTAAHWGIAGGCCTRANHIRPRPVRGRCSPTWETSSRRRSNSQSGITSKRFSRPANICRPSLGRSPRRTVISVNHTISNPLAASDPDSIGHESSGGLACQAAVTSQGMCSFHERREASSLIKR